MQEISSSKLNRRVSLYKITIHSSEPGSSIRRIDSRVDNGERNVAETVERVNGLGAIGCIDDGVVLRLVVVRTAES